MKIYLNYPNEPYYHREYQDHTHISLKKTIKLTKTCKEGRLMMLSGFWVIQMHLITLMTQWMYAFELVHLINIQDQGWGQLQNWIGIDAKTHELELKILNIKMNWHWIGIHANESIWIDKIIYTIICTVIMLQQVKPIGFEAPRGGAYNNRKHLKQETPCS